MPLSQEEQKNTERSRPGSKNKKIMLFGMIGAILIIFIVIAVWAMKGVDNKNVNENLAKANVLDQETLEKNYKDGLNTILSDLDESMAYIVNLVNSKSHPDLFTSEESEKTDSHTRNVEKIFDRAKKLIPPDKFTEMHDLTLKAFKKYADAMKLFRQGVNELDVEKIGSSGILLEEGSVLLNQASDKYKEIK